MKEEGGGGGGGCLLCASPLRRNFSFKGFRNVPVYYRILPVKTRNEAVKKLHS